MYLSPGCGSSRLPDPYVFELPPYSEVTAVGLDDDSVSRPTVQRSDQLPLQSPRTFVPGPESAAQRRFPVRVQSSLAAQIFSAPSVPVVGVSFPLAEFSLPVQPVPSPHAFFVFPDREWLLRLPASSRPIVYGSGTPAIPHQFFAEPLTGFRHCARSAPRRASPEAAFALAGLSAPAQCHVPTLALMPDTWNRSEIRPRPRIPPPGLSQDPTVRWTVCRTVVALPSPRVAGGPGPREDSGAREHRF